MVAKQGWSGRTDEVIVPQLNAEFWSDGKSIEGKLEGWREAKYAERTAIFYRLELSMPLEIDGEKQKSIELAPITGLLAAFKSLKTKGYFPQKGDLWKVDCVGIKKAKKEGYSDSPEFEIGVTR